MTLHNFVKDENKNKYGYVITYNKTMNIIK